MLDTLYQETMSPQRIAEDAMLLGYRCQEGATGLTEDMRKFLDQHREDWFRLQEERAR